MKMTLGNITTDVQFNCTHPDLNNNICPTGHGDCVSCRYCHAELSASDFWTVYQSFTTSQAAN